ncbi:hypothetical protein K466DRAFT_604751 [Polyporus arcularius HHB13444]|uniref:Uncharacterized protein n=1 Tax=Polyporus arcularius HHB13444 TaxID=1314778 RepID=A0A5C3NVR3_9APHY|nr:hypothetical protein K466DRAFT_604751 [Polyporus arcularius HHB13444]
MSSPIIIDNTDSVVQYAPVTAWQVSIDSKRQLMHGAAETGLSATLAFVATGIQVIGTLQRTSGQPVATFTIDNEGNTTYAAPTYSSSEYAVDNVTFYSRQDLKLGNHELKIVNMNGTGTNVLWLSYFLVDTSPASSSVTSASSSQSSTSLKSSPSISASSYSSPSSSASPEATSSTSQSSTRGKTAAIAGGVVGGVALLVLLGVLLVLLWRRRCIQVGENGVRPFTENATRASIDGAGNPEPSKWSVLPLSAASPSSLLEVSTLDMMSPSSHAPASDNYATVEASGISPSQPPLEPLRRATATHAVAKDDEPASSAENPGPTAMSPAAPSPIAPLPTDIGQALAHASPELQSTALTLIRSLLQRNQPHDVLPRPAEVDSGLRIVDEAYVTPPPEYTAD